MTPVQRRFIHWILEREKARHCKDIGIPYKGDEIIRQYKFCNVNREHDAVTRWIAKVVRPKLKTLSLTETVHALYLCRVFNEPAVLSQIIGATHKVALNRLQSIKKSGNKILRGAYLVVPHGTSMPVEVFYMNVAAKVRELEYKHVTKLEEVAARLMSITGISDFMANQVCADLRYQPGRDAWADWDTFVLAGPGTRRGLARYMATGTPTRDTKGRIAKETGACAPLLLRIREDIKPYLPDDINEHLLDPNNLSNCFCEFDKYERARDGEASLRKYHGNH